MAEQKKNNVGTTKSGGRVSDSRSNVPVKGGRCNGGPTSSGGSHSAGPKTKSR